MQYPELPKVLKMKDSIHGRQIMLYARDPGGANSVLFLAQELRKRGYGFQLLGKEFAVERYRSFGLPEQEFCAVSWQDEPDIWAAVTRFSPAVIVTGTSAEDFSERRVWAAAAKLGIPAIAILDQWVNYGIRFSRFSLREQADYQANKQDCYVPSCICLMDEKARQGMLAEGIAPEILKVTGNPYFQHLANLAEDQKQVNTKQAGVYKILFASECLIEDYGQDVRKIIGYDEKYVLNYLVSALLKLTDERPLHLHLKVRLHPRDTAGKYDEFLLSVGARRTLTVSIDNNTESTSSIREADCVAGMASAVLTEAVIMGKKVLSMQPNSTGFITFNFKDYPGVVCARNVAEVVSGLGQCIDNEGIGSQENREIFTIDATANIINLMEELLCPCLQ